MEIELRLPSRLEAVIKNLTRYRPPAMLAGWTVISYQFPVQVQANAETRLSSQVDIRREDEWAFVVVDLLIGELTKDESSKLHILLEAPDLSSLTPSATPDKVPPFWTPSRWANYVASTPLALDSSPLSSDHHQQNPQDALAAWLDWFCRMLEQDYQGVAEQLEALALELGVIGGEVTEPGAEPAVIDGQVTAPRAEPAGSSARHSKLTAEQEATLRHLWANDNYSHADIAKKLGPGYTADWTRKTGYKLGLGKRKSGAKPGR